MPWVRSALTVVQPFHDSFRAMTIARQFYSLQERFVGKHGLEKLRVVEQNGFVSYQDSVA
jgi:hypothetical protein